MRSVFGLFMAAPILYSGANAAVMDRESGYGNALRVANKYLGAWRLRDFEGARGVVAPELLSSNKDIRQEIVGLSNPHHMAYEIKHGGRVRSGVWRFPVRLGEEYTDYQASLGRRQWLEVRQLRDSSWKVSRLPASVDSHSKPKSGDLLPLANVNKVLESWAAFSKGKSRLERDSVRGLRISDEVLKFLNAGMGNLKAFELRDSYMQPDGSVVLSVTIFGLEGEKSSNSGRFVVRRASPTQQVLSLFNKV